MKTHQLLSNLRKLHERTLKTFLAFVVLMLGFTDVNAQHVFSISYNELSLENTRRINAQVERSRTAVAPMARNISGEYAFSLSSTQNTQIILLNAETGSNVVITPTEDAPAEFVLPPFFIEELRQAGLGDTDQLLMIEAGADFSVRNARSISRTNEDIFIPRFFYGPKENVREALPRDRRIIHIFKERPRLIPAFPDDPESLRRVAQLEEEMSYFVFMYELPDGTKVIFDENFVDLSVEENIASTNATHMWGPLRFSLSGNLNDAQRAVTQYAFDLWSKWLAGTVTVSTHISYIPLDGNVLGRAFHQPHFWRPATRTWYSSAQGNQIARYNVVPRHSDIRMEMNSNFTWNLLIEERPVGIHHRDWLTVVLHEITHGLGFAALVGENGRFRYTTTDILGRPVSRHTNYPGIFDHQLFQGTSGPSLVALNQAQRSALVISDNLFAGTRGPSSHLLRANNGNRVRMHAPPIWSDGSSVSHWHQYWDWESDIPRLMRPNYTGQRHSIDRREVAIMWDMGWERPFSLWGPTTICYEGFFLLSDQNLRADWQVSPGFVIATEPNNVRYVIVWATHMNGQTGTLTATMGNGVVMEKTIQACYDPWAPGPISIVSLDETSTICGRVGFSLNHPSLDATWSVFPTSGFEIVYQSLHSNHIKVTSTGLAQVGVLSARVNGTTVASKNIWSCNVSITGPNTICGTADFFLSDTTLRAVWSIPTGSGFSRVGHSFPNPTNYVSIRTSVLNGQSTTIQAHIVNDAGELVTTITRTIRACSVSIVEGNVVCTAGATFSLSDANTQANWSISAFSGFSIISQASDVNSVTVRPTRLDGQSGTLWASVNGVTVSRTIRACNVFILGEETFCGTTTFYLSDPNLRANWSIPQGFVAVSPVNNVNYVRIDGNSNRRIGMLTATVGAGFVNGVWQQGIPISKDITHDCFDLLAYIAGPPCFPICTRVQLYELVGARAVPGGWSVTPAWNFEILNYSENTVCIAPRAFGPGMIEVLTTCGNTIRLNIQMCNLVLPRSRRMLYEPIVEPAQVYLLAENAYEEPNAITIEEYPTKSYWSYIVFPNPVSSILHFQVDVSRMLWFENIAIRPPARGEVVLFNMQGQQVLRQAISNINEDFEIDVSMLSAGTYIVSVVYNGEAVHSQNIVVRH